MFKGKILKLEKYVRILNLILGLMCILSIVTIIFE